MNATTSSKLSLPLLILLRWLYSFVAASMAVSFSLVEWRPGFLAAISLIVTALLAAACYNKKTVLISGIGLPLLLLFGMWLSGTPQPVPVIWSYLSRLVGQIVGLSQYRYEDGTAITLLLAVLFSLVAAAFLRRRLHFVPIGLSFLACYLISLFAEQTIPLSLTIAAVLLSMTLLLLSRYRHVSTERPGGRSGWTAVSFAALLSAIAVSIVWLLPRPQTALSAPLRSRYFSAQDWFDSISGGGGYTGFSDGRTVLGGDLQLDSTHVMDVKANQPLYMTGAVYSRYDGRSWETAEAKMMEIDGSTLRVVPQPLIPDLVNQSVTCRIRPARDTEYLFHAGEIQSFDSLKTSLLTDGNGNFQAGDKLSAGDEYISRGIPKSMSDEAAFHAGKGYFSRETQDREWYDRAYEESRWAADNYLDLPPELPERVRTLAREITAHAPNDYERLRMLEAHLCQLPYTLHPGETPAGQDFVDYFLFEQRQGYCNHFASAMAVMSRCIGLPSRFVKGYVLPGVPEEDGYYRVTNYMAHAWVEVYLEGFGWLAFEPTAAYNEEYRLQVDAKDIRSGEENYYQQLGVLPSGTHVTQSKPSSPQPSATDMTQHMPLASAMPSQTASNGMEVQKRIPEVWLPFAVLGLLLSASLWLLWRCNRANRYQQRLQILHKREGGLLLLDQIMGIAAYLEQAPQDGETLRTAMERTTAELTLPSLQEALPILEKLLYSEQDISAEEEATVRVFAAEYLQCVREKKGRIRFWWSRWIGNRF